MTLKVPLSENPSWMLRRGSFPVTPGRLVGRVPAASAQHSGAWELHTDMFLSAGLGLHGKLGCCNDPPPAKICLTFWEFSGNSETPLTSQTVKA